MRALCWMILSLLFVSVSVPSIADAADERVALRFREGQTIKYQYKEVLEYFPPNKFAGSNNQLSLTVLVDYTFKVTGVNPDQSAMVKLTFDRIVVEREGVQIADMPQHQIPNQGQNITALLDVNGGVTFYKYVYLTFNPAGILEYRIVNGGNAMATKSVALEGENELFAADLDASSGMIRVGVPPTRDLSDPELALLSEIKIDLTPRKLYQLLLLPTAPLDSSKRFVVPFPYFSNVVYTSGGRSDVQGRRTEKVIATVSPWDHPGSKPGYPGTYEPAMEGEMSYFIDPELGRLVMAEGSLNTKVRIPEIGEQVAKVRIKLVQVR